MQQQISLTTNFSSNNKCGKRIFNSSFNQTTTYFGAKLIRQTKTINFNGTSYI